MPVKRKLLLVLLALGLAALALVPWYTARKAIPPPLAPLDATLPETSPVTGQVLDSHHRPIPFARVQIAPRLPPSDVLGACPSDECRPIFHYCRAWCPYEGAREQAALQVVAGVQEWRPHAELTADAEGHFSWIPDAPGPFTLGAMAPGFAFGVRHELSDRSRQREDPFLIVLYQARELQGVVVDEQGIPLGETTLIALSPLWPRFFARTNNPDGTFDFDGMTDGALLVVAHRDGLLPDALPFAPGQRPVARLVLKSPRNLEVQVRDAGHPVSGALVSLHRNPYLERKLTEAKGEAQFDQLYPGSYSLLARFGSQVAVATPILSDPMTRVTLDLRPGHDLSGRVLDEEGKPLHAVASAFLGSQLLSARETDGDGRFRIEALPEGITVEIRAPEHLIEHRADPGKEPLQVTLRRQLYIRGTVSSQSGLRIPEVRVRMRDHAETALTDLDGLFRLPISAPGRFQLFVHHSVFGKTEQTIDGPASDLSLVLAPLSGFHGYLIDPKGEPLEGGRADAISLAPGPHDRYTTDVRSEDSEGRVTILGLEPGHYRVHFSAPGYKPRDLADVELPPDTVVELPPLKMERESETP